MKRVLIISYYWPPAGGPGVQRWLKFCKYLPDFDIEPVVYVPENPFYPNRDESLVDEVPDGLEVIRRPINEPYKLASSISSKSTQTISKGLIPPKKRQGLLERLLLYIRGNFFIPDARKAWIKPSVAYLKDYLVSEKIDTIITTGPPHSMHLIGMKLKEQLGLRWIADFRDPWTTIGYHSKLKLSGFARKRHQKLELKVLNHAEAIITTSLSTKVEFETKTSKPVSVITNGYDDRDLGSVQIDKRFSISHIGSLLTERNPLILWEILNELTLENNTFKSLLQINLVGSVSQEVVESIEKYDLSRYLNLTGYVSHLKAQEYQRKSQVLLLIEIDSEATKSIIPGKLFEYLVSERPILAIGPEGSDIKQILSETNTGTYFTCQDKSAIKQTIIEYFNAFQSGELYTSGIGLQKYHRKELTEKLAEIILK